MKVVYLTGPGRGGSNVSLMQSILELKRNGVQPLVVAPRHEIKDWFEKEGIPVVVIDNKFNVWQPHHSLLDCLLLPIRMLKNFSINIIGCYKLTKLLKSEQPDIVHTNISVLSIGYWAARIMHIPHVWHVREYINKDFGYSPYPTFNLFARRLRLNHCIAISRDIAKHFKLTDNNAKVIYNGITNKDTVATKKRNIFLFVGALIPGKGIADAIEAFIMYANQGGLYDLLIVGSGKDEYVDFLKKQVPEELKNRVIFKGQVSNAEDIMTTSKAIIVPSVSEAFGRVTAEAMLCRCLVIGRDTGGTKEQFDNGYEMFRKEIGLRFNSVDQLLQHLKAVEQLNDELYNETIELAYSTARHLYSTERNATELLKYYNNLIR